MAKRGRKPNAVQKLAMDKFTIIVTGNFKAYGVHYRIEREYEVDSELYGNLKRTSEKYFETK